MSCLQSGFFRPETAVSADPISVSDFGDILLEMCDPFGVGAVAVGSLPPDVPTCFERQAPAHPCLGAQRIFGWFGNRTHLFVRGDVGEAGAYRLYDGSRSRDEELSRLGPGLAFAIAPGDTRRQGAVFYLAREPQDRATRRTLSLIANYAYARLVTMERPMAKPNLSDRELEVLAWAAEGKTDQEIGAIIGLSSHTIDKYMRQIKTSLDAATRTGAIVAAIRCGLIF
jgi:LuxR family quorum sensing-dependent transcriptional regulator